MIYKLCCSLNQCRNCLIPLAIIQITCGIILLVFWPEWSKYVLRAKLILQPGTDNYKNWLEPPIPIYLSFYMFNWTNPQEIQNPNVKPNFVELGPYVFLERHLKENLTFNSNDTVTFYQRRTWYFDKEKSNGSLDDMITTAHVISATVADEMRSKNPLIKKVINLMLNHEGGKLFTTQSVNDWIFNGYQDNLMDFLNLFNTSSIHIPYKRFGWMVERNDSLTYDGLFTIHTGVDDISRLGAISHWNHRNETGFYDLPCGAVKGTMADIFPPNLSGEKKLTIFITDACRYLTLQSNDTTKNDYGLPTIEWLGVAETLDTGADSAKQKCFCEAGVTCPQNGVVGCKKCRHNAPISLSYPHFYLASPEYINAVDGLQPIADKHKFSLFVEPNTGIVVHANGRLQMNMRLNRDDDFDIYKGIQSFLLPIFWFEQSATLSEDLLSKTRMASNLELYGFCGGIILTIFGGTLVISIIIIILIQKFRSSQETDEEILTDQ